MLTSHVRVFALSEQVFIGTVCAYGGFDWVAHRELERCCDYSLFGTQLIPWCCGTLEYGKVNAPTSSLDRLLSHD